jgi:hypothetical protein
MYIAMVDGPFSKTAHTLLLKELIMILAVMKFGTLFQNLVNDFHLLEP